MNKKILEICLSPGLGGLELFTLHCHNYFSQKGECKIVVAPNKKLDHYIEGTDKLYIKRNKIFPFLPAYKLAKYIDKNDIDILHFHWNKDMVTVVLAKLFSIKKPSIILTRHMEMTRFKDDIYHRWLYNNISTIHAVTQRLKEQLIKFIPKEIRPAIQMVYLGVDEPVVNKKTVEKLKKKYQLEDAFVVGIIGRIEEAKGQHLIIEVIAKLKKFNIKALIVGSDMDDSYLSKLKKQINKFGIEGQVIFTGFTKEINEHIQLCDVTVLATQNETFGLVVIESMANKIPVISTANGGPLEIIDNEIDGLFFDKTSENLALKIELIYNNTNLKHKLSMNTYKKIKIKFDKATQMKKIYQVINKC